MSEVRFRSLVENSGDLIWEIDADMRYRYVSPRVKEILGYEVNNIVGKSLFELIPVEEIEKNQRLFITLIKEGQSFSELEKIAKHKDGHLIVFETSGNPIVNENGVLVGYRGTDRDITQKKYHENELRKTTEKIEHLAYYDSLTLLPNRILFRDYLEQACLNADSNNTLVGILFIDIDHFKTVNDTLGHAAGDLLIQSVALRLRDCIGVLNKLSRFGGDEFAVLIPNLCNREQLDSVVASIFKKLKEVIRIQEHEFFITLSIGSIVYPLDDTGTEYLLRDADTAMHLAKKLGRNQHQHYSKSLTDAATRTLVLQNGLRKALQNNELVLHYQPQMNLLDGRIIGAEALVRWQHPEEGLKPPGEFIAAAEESGLIVEMGKWILQTACKQAKVWQDQGLSHFTMAINLSARQFKEDGFAQSVVDIIQETGANAHLIELELTESILADNSIEVSNILSDLKKAGTKISLDDFGTGYSSLSYLKLFPIDKLKIDQSFVRDMLTDKSDASLVRAIIAMAKALGLTTIAEGVENKEQLEFLNNEGCEEIQGYWLSKPMTAEAFQQFLSERKSMQA